MVWSHCSREELSREGKCITELAVILKGLLLVRIVVWTSLGQVKCKVSVMINGLSIVRDSNKSGWLHTFLSCISTFMMLKKSELTSVVCVLSLLMYSSYRRRCLRLKLHWTMCSIFSGSYFSTSRFMRRRRKGLRIDCSFYTTPKFRD